MGKTIDITVEVDYGSIDKVIELLTEIRAEHGSKCILDIGTYREPYSEDEIPYVSVIVKGK